MLKKIYYIALRECGIIRHTPIYWFCMLVFPLITIIFFTSLMDEGVPEDMPVGVVDLDNTPTTRTIIRKLDAFQTTHVAYRYNSVDEARRAMQQTKIYAFLYLPKGTTSKLVAGRQPQVSFYYNSVFLSPGSTLMRDMKTILTLSEASVGMQKLQAVGQSTQQIKAFLQPIAIDLHMVNNPWTNYNVYLSSVMLPGVLLVFVFLLAPYSIGTELKFKRSKEWMRMAGNNIAVALIGKMLPQFLVSLFWMYAYEFYVFGFMHFPMHGSIASLLWLGFATVLASESFGVFAFGLMPQLRMAMSICSLWAVMSFSLCGATFPVMAMDPMIQSLAALFPLRHFYMIYQIGIFNGYPFEYYRIYVAALLIFAVLPFFTAWNIKKAMLHYIYLP